MIEMDLSGAELVERTMGEGGVIKHLGRSAVVRWEPGDGTAYTMIFSVIPHSVAGWGSTIVGTIGDQSLVGLMFGDGEMLHLGHAVEMLPESMNRRTIMAFVIVANWLHGDVQYGTELYRHRFCAGRGIDKLEAG